MANKCYIVRAWRDIFSIKIYVTHMRCNLTYFGLVENNDEIF